MEKKRMLNSILCAIAFGLIGCVVFGVLYYFGYIAAIGGYLIFFLASLGYKKYNGNVIDKKGYTILLAISLFELIISIFVSLAITIMNIYNVNFSESLSLFSSFFAKSEFTSALIRDIFMSFLFLVIALLVDYFSAKKKAKNMAIQTNTNNLNDINSDESNINQDSDK